MAGNIQVPKDLKDEKALRAFLTDIGGQSSGQTTINKTTVVNPTTAIPMDTSEYDNNIKYNNLELLFKSAVGTSWTEYSYLGEKLQQIDIWETSAKTTKMYTKVFTYTGDYISQIVLTDIALAFSLTKVYTIVDGKLITKGVQ